MGFHTPERWGVWTGQAQTSLTFSTTGSAWANVRTVTLEAYAFVAPDAVLPAQVTVNGRMIGILDIGRHKKKYRMDVGELILRPGIVINVAIETPSPLMSPSDHGRIDRRRLGIAISNLSFNTA